MWATLSATFLAHNWVDTTIDDRIGCVLGVAGGAGLWFLLLAWAVSKGHGRFSPRVLLRMEHVSGALLLIAALFIGWRIVSKLHELRTLKHRDKSAASPDVRAAFQQRPGIRVSFNSPVSATRARSDRCA
jgi:hypothetical protein